MTRLFGAVTLLIALVVTPGYLFYFDVTPKLVILLAGTAAACAWAGLSRGVEASRRHSRVYRVFCGLLAAAAGSLAVSTAFSRHPALSAFGTNWRRFGAVSQCALLVFAWLVARHVAGRPDRIRTILRFVALSAALAGVYGILQYFGWDPLLPAAAYHVGEGLWTIVRPPGTMGYVSYFANWLLGAAFLCALLAAMEPPGTWRTLAVAACAVATCAMLLTGTRAAIFGLFVGIIVWLSAHRVHIPRRAAVVSLLVIAAGTAFYFSPAGWLLHSRARWFAEDPFGGARLWLWRDGLHMAGKSVAAGFGPEVFTVQFPAFESVELARAYPDFVHESPHNLFLDALVAQGIPGCGILLALCALGLWSARRHPALAAALAATIAANQFTVFILPTAFLFFLTVALAVALESGPVERPFPVSLRACAAATALLFAFCTLRYSAADRSLALASRSLTRGDAASAATHYARYDRWRFPGTSAALWYSRALFSFAGSTDNAIVRVQALALSGSAAVRATAEAEDPCDAWYNAAGLYAAQNDFPRTEAALRTAITANPRWFKPHWTLARALALAGRSQEAAREAAIAADLDGGRNPEVETTLHNIRASLR